MDYKKVILVEKLNALSKRMLDHIYDRVMVEEKISPFSTLFFKIEKTFPNSDAYYVKDNVVHINIYSRDDFDNKTKYLYTITSDKSRVLIFSDNASIIAPELMEMLKYHLQHFLKIVNAFRELNSN